MTIKTNKIGWRVTLFGTMLFALVGARTASALTGLLGDVNLDGAINVLDIQNTINQALGVAGETPEANLDENGQVDVLDVQNMVNSVLGTGGLVQPMSGTLDCERTQDRLRIMAVSQDGSCEVCDVDCETYQFRIRLRVKTGWSFAVMRSAGEGQPETCAGTFEFAIGDTTSCTLPIPGLSRGEELSLGPLGLASRIRAEREIRAMLGQLCDPIDPSDDNGNGIPDFVEPLLERLRTGPGMPGGIHLEPLYAAIEECIAAWLEQITTPDLTDADADGIPDFIEPLIDCVLGAIQDWLEGEGVQVPPGDHDGNGIPDAIDALVHHLVQGIPGWLATLNRPELVDSDGDGIPDFIEDHLSLPGIPSHVDGDGDGVPDFAEDDDSDGIPNIADDNAHVPGDVDGDGVDDGDDLDDDNDDIPDYAE